MGLEVLSNVGATYKEVPREIIKLDTSNTSNLQYDRGVQTIAQTETKAVQNAENNKDTQKRVDDFFKKIESDFLRKNTVYTSSHLKKCRDDVVMLEEINQKLSDNVNVGIIGTPALVAIDELLKDNKVVPKDRLDVIFL